jgi:hypothetical protein
MGPGARNQTANSGRQRPAAGAHPVLTDRGNGHAHALDLALWRGPQVAGELTAIGRSLPDHLPPHGGR